MLRRDIFNLFNPLNNKRIKKETQPIYIRPPYNIDKELFERECPKCDGLCKDACEENIIIIKDDKTPILNFTETGCTFCQKCLEVCESEVLNNDIKKIDIEIKINQLTCMAWHNTICTSCKDPCLDNAINFSGYWFPEINIDKCTGCGFCLSVCPIGAIDVKILK